MLSNMNASNPILISCLSVVVVPLYILLSLLAMLSRYVSFLGILASHGKTHEPTSHWWSRHIPKRYFTHFYIVGIGSFVLFRYYFADTALEPLPWTQLSLLLHLTRRLYECIRVHRFRPTSQMHIAGYLLGLGHYIILPVVFLGRQAPHSKGNLFSLLCYVCNFWMQYEQHVHHQILANLRRRATEGHSSTYSLPPHQRWFQWSLCPHYLAEILIYASWSMLLTQEKTVPFNQPLESTRWSNRSVLSSNLLLRLSTQRHWFLFLWVSTNLTVSALNNRDWYRKRYPQLKVPALFPF